MSNMSFQTDLLGEIVRVPMILLDPAHDGHADSTARCRVRIVSVEDGTWFVTVTFRGAFRRVPMHRCVHNDFSLER
jgi:hypothetical protein